jgi:hypothetical protein
MTCPHLVYHLKSQSSRLQNLWSRRPISQRAVGTKAIIRPSPVLDNHLGLEHCIENLAIEKFVPKLPIERLRISILPRTTRLDKQCPASFFPVKRISMVEKSLKIPRWTQHGDAPERRIRGIIDAGSAVAKKEGNHGWWR